MSLNKIKELKSNIVNEMITLQKKIKEHLNKKNQELAILTNIINDKEKNLFFPEIISNLQQIFNLEKINFSRNFDEEYLENILNEYKNITGIEIVKTDKKYIKVCLTFFQNLKEKNEVDQKKEYYFVFSQENEMYSIKEIVPENIIYKPYLLELNLTNNIGRFFAKIINEYFQLLN